MKSLGFRFVVGLLAVATFGNAGAFAADDDDTGKPLPKPKKPAAQGAPADADKDDAPPRPRPRANAPAPHGYGTAGCGLGALIFKDKPGIVQIFAATTNATSYNQTFAISSGTSHCDQGGGGGREEATADDQRLHDFIAANLATLKVEAARGQGDSVVGLAALMGCAIDPATTRSFGAMTKARHAQIFATSAPHQVATALDSGVRADRDLNAHCTSPALAGR